ncbi:MAG: PDC sensor domain-containing protein [Spirochaetales bacterium]|nr:PDC sensor domain-containing protein [Spirochaetales bacterium]
MMKKLTAMTLSTLMIMFVLSGCERKSTQSGNTTSITSGSESTGNASMPYEVENKITSPVITNKIMVLINDDILNWIENSIIVETIIKSNRENAGRSQEKINELDERWRKSEETSDFIRSYLDNEASDFLRKVQKSGDMLYSEIFVMDIQGCNVALSNKTSDFWQGDEDKFTIAYNNGNGKIFIDEIEYDESTQENLVQISLPVKGTNTSKVIGTITIGLNIDRL